MCDPRILYSEHSSVVYGEPDSDGIVKVTIDGEELNAYLKVCKDCERSYLTFRMDGLCPCDVLGRFRQKILNRSKFENEYRLVLLTDRLQRARGEMLNRKKGTVPYEALEIEERDLEGKIEILRSVLSFS